MRSISPRYGHDTVTVESDHKPLKTIFKKSFNDTPTSCSECCLIYSHIVNASYVIVYRGRAVASGCQSKQDVDISDGVIVHVNDVRWGYATPEKLSQFKIETGRDSILSCGVNYYQNGWPSNKTDCQVEARAFWSLINSS